MISLVAFRYAGPTQDFGPVWLGLKVRLAGV